MKFFKWILKTIKNIGFFIIKEIFSFFIKSFLFLIIILAIGTTILYKKENAIKKNITQNSYVLINLGESFKEKTSTKNIFDDSPISFYNLLDSVYNISKDERINGIIFKLDNLALNYAQIEELSKNLTALKNVRNFKTISYMENTDRKNLYLASFTDKIYMPKTNSTSVNIYPYFRETLYKKNLLDKLGIKVNIIHIGDYKSYGEDLSSSNMSKENREDTTRILEENYQNFLDVVSKNLNYDRIKLDKLVQSGNLVAACSKDLLANKLISGFMYWNDIENIVGKDKIISLNDYIKETENLSTNSSNSKNKIYVMTLEGAIVYSSEDIFDNMFISAKSVIDDLDKLEKDDEVKGLVIRINSPGGSALTSDKINAKIKEFKKKKPVYISMGGVAASGGYYISSNANKIFANENTITGSIGVVSMIPNFSKLLEKTEVNNEKISKGKFADLYSFDEMTEEKYNKILKSNLNVYDDFLNEVTNGRKIDRKKLEKIAEGRIWSGKEAKQIGLIDEIGGFNSAIYTMINDLNIQDNYEIVFIEDKFDIKNIYKKYSKFLKADSLELIKNKIYNENLYNKPILYMPYEILD